MCVNKSTGTLYWRTPAGAVLAESDLNGNITEQYIFFAGRRVARRDPSGNVFYFFTDHLGTTHSVTDATGHPCYDASFTPYGQEVLNPGVAETCPPNFRFTGFELDGETATLTSAGNYYAKARHYSPRLARFLSPDPLGGSPGAPQSHNGYAYVVNMPLMLTDPSGMIPCYPGARNLDNGKDQEQGIRAGHYLLDEELGEPDPQYPGAGNGQGDCPGWPTGGNFIDGGYVGGATGLFGNDESTVQCPNNVCSGFGTDSKGNVHWAEFIATAGGVTGYYDPQQLTNGIYDYGGNLYNSENFQALLQQQYATRIASQCGTVTQNVAGDLSGTGAAVASCNGGRIEGGNANFQINCGGANNGDCAGRYPSGLHIEYDPVSGMFWGHNDAASPYIGSSFNWGTFNPWNLVVHFTVDVLGGNTAYYVLPH